MIRTALRTLVLTAAVATAPLKASAQVVVYNDLTSWLAATSSVGIDTYDNLGVSAYNSPLNRTAGSYTYQVSTTGQLFPGGDTSNRFMSTNTATSVMTFGNFSPTVRAIGANFFSSDIYGEFVASQQITVFYTVTGQAEQSVILSNPTMSTFFGIVSTSAVNNIRVQSFTPDGAQDFNWGAVDNLRLAQAGVSVPEPSTVILLATGLAGLGAATRRRRA